MKRIILFVMVCLALIALLLPVSACYTGDGSGPVYTTVHHGYGYGPGWGGYGWGGRGYYPPGGVIIGPPVVW